jgi:hypothetical protein
MPDNSELQDNLDQNEEVNASGDQQNPVSEEEANKPQPNVILNKVGGKSNATSYHDTERVSPRANEASDQKDTNTGGIIAGGAKGTSQS